MNGNNSTVPDYLELTTLPEPRVVDLDSGVENLDVDLNNYTPQRFAAVGCAVATFDCS